MSADLTPAVVGAIAAITAAFIGLIVAVTSAVIAKEQKVSEFRQAWIEKLREDIAEIVSLSYSVIVEKEKLRAYQTAETTQFENKGVVNQKVYDGIFECRRNSILLMGNIFKTSILIKLRLNPKEHMLILDAVKLLITNLQDETSDTKTNFLDLEKVQALSSEVLKSEWERVKKGEKHFVRFRYFVEICLFSFITAFFVLLVAVKLPEYFPDMFN